MTEYVIRRIAYHRVAGEYGPWQVPPFQFMKEGMAIGCRKAVHFYELVVHCETITAVTDERSNSIAAGCAEAIALQSPRGNGDTVAELAQAAQAVYCICRDNLGNIESQCTVNIKKEIFFSHD